MAIPALATEHRGIQPAVQLQANGVMRAARRCYPQSIWPVDRRKLDQINRVRDVNELKVPPGNRLEELKGDRQNQYSIRINQQYRICFT